MSIVDKLREDRENGAKWLEAEYKAGLLTLARRLCADEGDAEELVNRTFAAVVEGIDDYLEQSAFFGWMCQILSNIHAKDIRRKMHGAVTCPGEMPDMPDDGDVRLFREVDAALLRDAIEELPPDMRDAMMMRYFMDMPLLKVAKILSVPVGTVNSRLHYARRILAARLGTAVKKPAGKAIVIALALAALTAVGAAVARVAMAPTPSPSQADGTDGEGAVATTVAGRPLPTWAQPLTSTASTFSQATPVSPAPSDTTTLIQGETMNTTARTTAVLASVLAVQAAVPATALADTPRRPMALMIMVDGLRADAVETAYMPNLAKLRSGEWQADYGAAWSLDAQIAPSSIPSSAPNHTSIATGVAPSKHKVTKNGETASKGDFATYPTWLKRVVDADPSKSALFIYKTWEDDDALGPATNVTFESGTDAENAASLASKLASASAPDATMYFIDAVDDAGHSYGFYPMSDQYLAALQTADGYLGACLNAIAARSTFASEDWLIMVTSDHGGYATYHGEITVGRQGHTIPLIIAGRSVTSGRIPGLPYNMDVAASALAHFGVTASGLDATLRDNTAAAEPSRTLSDGLVAYLPFDSSLTENAVVGSSVSPTKSGTMSLEDGGMSGSYCDFPEQRYNYIQLDGSDTGTLTYEDGNTCFAATIWVKMPPPAAANRDPPIFANKAWTGINKGVLLFAGYSKLDSANIGNPRGVGLNAGNGINNQTTGRIDMGLMDYEDPSDWTFYAITHNVDGVITLYQGRQDGSLDWISGELSGFTMATGYPFCIGNDAGKTYDRYFIGGVDDFGLWTRALTHDEIRRIYSAGRAGIPLGTLASASAGPATATWTGAVSSDMTVAGNWSGNVVPTVDTDAIVSGAVSITLAEGATLPCKSIFFDNVTLGADADLRGLDAAKIVAGSSLDLNGHALWLRAGSSLPLAVTDSSANAAAPGEFHLDDTGLDIANTTMALSGNLRFVKSGAGKFTASASATYTGGFAVEGGTFVMARYAAGNIYVGNATTLDMYGYNLTPCNVMLAGGTITTTKNNQNVTLPQYMTLTDDSSIVYANLSATRDMGVPQNAVWNLGGKTLNVVFDGYDPDFNMLLGETISNGTFKATVNATAHNNTGKAWVQFANLYGQDGLNLDLGTTILRLKHQAPNNNSKVCDFTCNPLAGQTIYSGNLLEIYGIFTPQSTDGFNMKMMDGSTLDISAWNGVWNCAFANSGGYAGGSNTGCKVSFEDGATVTVNLAGRSNLNEIATAQGLVAKWASGAVPAASTQFVLDAATAALPQGYSLRKTDEGLQLRKTDAFTLIIR